MAILEGTTEDGALVPVQVTDTGRVVAEGLTGPEGPEGPQGEKGDKGDQGDPGSPGNLWSGSDPGDISYDGGNVGIGTTSPSALCHIEAADTAAYAVTAGSANSARVQFGDPDDRDIGMIVYQNTDDSMRFHVNAQERFRVDSAGRILVGTTTAPNRGSGQYSNVVFEGYIGDANGESIVSFQRGQTAGNLSEGTDIGLLNFTDSVGNTFARITGTVDATPGTDNYPGRISFSTTSDGSASPTTKLTIDRSGDVIFQGSPIIKSPDGKHWAIEVDNNGNLGAYLVI